MNWYPRTTWGGSKLEIHPIAFQGFWQPGLNNPPINDSWPHRWRVSQWVLRRPGIAVSLLAETVWRPSPCIAACGESVLWQHIAAYWLTVSLGVPVQIPFPNLLFVRLYTLSRKCDWVWCKRWSRLPHRKFYILTFQCKLSLYARAFVKTSGR